MSNKDNRADKGWDSDYCDVRWGETSPDKGKDDDDENDDDCESDDDE